MDPYNLIAALAVITFVLVIVLARASKWQTDKRRDDPEAGKTSLATDGREYSQR